jgi:hypothetical protein
MSALLLSKNLKIKILHGVSHGFEIWCLILEEDHRLRRIFGHKDKVNGGLKKYIQ